MYYVCQGLHLGSGVYVSGDRRDPQRLDVTTSSVARYVTRGMDFGLGHHASFLGKRPFRVPTRRPRRSAWSWRLGRIRKRVFPVRNDPVAVHAVRLRFPAAYPARALAH